MHIFLIEQNVDLAPIVNPTDSFKIFKQSDILSSALVMDQTIFGSRRTIDWVLFTRISNIKFDEFCLMEKYVPQDSKTIFSAKENSFDCFYCRPAMYTIFANMSKTADHEGYYYLGLSRQRIDIQWL